MKAAKLNNIIKHYRQDILKNPDRHIVDCTHATNFHLAIELAATARTTTGKKHPHQWRVPSAVLSHFAKVLVDNAGEIRKVKSFNELYERVEACKVKGVGELTIYDTAHRIGSHLGLNPDKVYLHSGTRIGAEKLIGRVKEKSITRHQLPLIIATSDLTEVEIEDILCRYKHLW